MKDGTYKDFTKKTKKYLVLGRGTESYKKALSSKLKFRSNFCECKVICNETCLQQAPLGNQQSSCLREVLTYSNTKELPLICLLRVMA